MSNDQQHSERRGENLEGAILCPGTQEELAKAVDLAFDYRGDVTIELISGERVEGYVFNRVASQPKAYLELFPKGRPGIRMVGYDEVVSIIFSGEDTAFGKSWDVWITKKQGEEKKASSK